MAGTAKREEEGHDLLPIRAPDRLTKVGQEGLSRVTIPRETLNLKGELNYLKQLGQCTAPKPAKREEVGLELLLISAPSGSIMWWIKGTGLAQMDSGGSAVL